MMRLALLLVVGVAAASLALTVPADAAGAQVVRVVDGDTFVVEGGERIRVLVMDSCESNTPGGKRAKADAEALLDGQRVRLTAEPGHDVDRYDRPLRYVELPDGRDYAEVMLGRDHTALYGGKSDASAERMISGQGADTDGRACD